jgi:regulator of protease activity HflC (stomatin/prohibitin superfamily)
MLISADISLSYTLRAEKVPAFYVKFRSDDLDKFTHGYLRNVARDMFNETAGKYSIEQIMGDNAPFLQEVRQKLQAQVDNIGVVIEQFGLIGAPRPPDAVIGSINAKVQAQQIALQKQNEIMQAEAEAKKAVAVAEGEAKAKIALAEGEARANQLLAGSISPVLIEWQKLRVQQQAIDKWNGVRPEVEAGTGATGLLLNVNPPRP